MHNLKTNFDKFLNITKSVFKDQINSLGNFRSYPNTPKMSDIEILALSNAAESIGIDSENYLFSKLNTDYLDDFPLLINRTNFNRRRKRLFPYFDKLNKHISSFLNENENVYMIDSFPIPVVQLAREKSSKICKQDPSNAPAKGYSAVQKNYFFGYKLHLILSASGVFHSMDITPASVHDVKYLSDIKYSGLNNCTLIGDKGYISATYKADLFQTLHINLETPYRTNQNTDYTPQPIFKRFRKKIETRFSQFNDQFMMKRNYAKSATGLFVRILSKVTASTLLQFINFINKKPINQIKHALAS